MSMYLREITSGLKVYYSNASEAEKIIVDCAMVAAGAAAVGGVIPILELPAMVISCVGAVWAMYIKVCKALKIKISDNLLKVLASAALSNIATNLIGAFAIELVTCFIPGLGMAAGAVTTFACVYLAGILFMNMLLSFAKKGVGPNDFSSLSEEDLKNTIKSQALDKNDVKQAKNIFKGNSSK